MYKLLFVVVHINITNNIYLVDSLESEQNQGTLIHWLVADQIRGISV